MMEMQDTINDLQRELSALGKTARRPVSDGVSTPGGGSVSFNLLLTLTFILQLFFVLCLLRLLHIFKYTPEAFNILVQTLCAIIYKFHNTL